MGIYACPRCHNPHGWWSGNMQDIHDCPGYPPKRKNMDDVSNSQPNPVPTVPEYPPSDAVEIMRAWFAERGAEFKPDEFPMTKPE